MEFSTYIEHSVFCILLYMFKFVIIVYDTVGNSLTFSQRLNTELTQSNNSAPTYTAHLKELGAAI